MRYILDDNGYIEAAGCSPIVCNNKSCTEYTGAVPEGYNTIEQWAQTANIRAYKIVDGNLAYDADRAAALDGEYKKIDVSLIVNAGVFTSSNKQIFFNLPLDRNITSAEDIKSVNLTKVQIRHADGGYIANGVDLATLGTVTYGMVRPNMIMVTLTLKTAASFTNNCPVVVYIVNGYITLK